MPGIAFLIALTYLTSIGLESVVAESKQERVMDPNSAVNQLDAIRDSQDLEGLERMVASTQPQMIREDPDAYLHFMLAVCRTLNSHEFGDYQRQSRLMRHYADAALNSLPVLSANDEFELLTYLEDDFDDAQMTTAGSDWANKRRARVLRWLRALRRVKGDEAFDFTDVPKINVEMPPGASLPAGAAPAAIEDRSLREQYAAADEKNRQHANEFANQWRLRALREKYFPHARRYIIRAYSQPPFDVAELERLLNEHLWDKNDVRQILQEVQPR
jgi:hypothetical protein